MTPLFARRERGVEFLDDPATGDDVRLRSLADVACANRLFGGARAVVIDAERAIAALDTRNEAVLVLDVGTGLGDIPFRLGEAAARRRIAVRTIGLDSAPSLAVASRARVDFAVCGDALSLPFADRSVDVVICSQVLHHFDGADATRLIRELDRVARAHVIVSDLRRGVVPAAGIWLASFPLRFHRVSRHDGVVSVLRGFTRHELATLVSAATGVRPRVRRRLGWRVTAGWRPDGASARASFDLGPLPANRRMRTVDERIVRAPLDTIFSLAADVERWPKHLSHYRYVRLTERDGVGGGVVQMSANRPFGPVNWPTWWTSQMTVAKPGGGADAPSIRFRHVGGITTGMDVEWSFHPVASGTHVRIVHVWDGPRWPLIGGIAAVFIIGPVFVHGIASRTLAGLAEAAERAAT